MFTPDVLDAEALDIEREYLAYAIKNDPHTRMLGHPSPVQGPYIDMRVWPVAERSGISIMYDGQQYMEKRNRELEEEALGWVLFLQVDSEPEAGMNWCDGGKVYFFIDTKDLKERRFDRCWHTFQTH